MNITALNCPNCGAPFNPPKDKNICFCGNCGTKMIVDNGEVFVNININKRSENINRYIDETSVEKARIIAEQQKAKHRFILTIIGIILGIIILYHISWFF